MGLTRIDLNIGIKSDLEIYTSFRSYTSASVKKFLDLSRRGIAVIWQAKALI